ncbi:hypothetical protein GW17_00049675 [Ensete ventricosum]|nr:hypothetical protein GW17_00049675 [Ensete ventricosum]
MRARRHLVFPRKGEGEALPRLLARGRGNTSFARWKMRCRLFRLRDAAAPRSTLENEATRLPAWVASSSSSGTW